jgi:hypothetical protein
MIPQAKYVTDDEKYTHEILRSLRTLERKGHKIYRQQYWL